MMLTLQKLEALEAKILDPSARFSAIESLRELSVLNQELTLIDAEPKDQQRALHLIHLVQFKVEKFGEAFEYGQRALQAFPEIAHLSKNANLMFPYRMGECCLKLQRFSEAVPFYRRVLAAMNETQVDDSDAKLGTLEKIGYCLHEAGAFEEALTNNLELLDRAEKFFGEHDPTLSSVLTNLANNSYELGDLDGAIAYLERGYAICSKEPEKCYEFLFQLGVLTAEVGDIDAAHDWFHRQLAMAELLEDELFIEEAWANIQMLKAGAA